MKNKTVDNRIFNLCIVASIIFLSLKLTGVWDIPWILVILPPVIYLVFCLSVFAIVWPMIVIITAFQCIFCSSRPNLRCSNTPAMYWDPVSKQFYMNGEPVDNTEAFLDNID